MQFAYQALTHGGQSKTGILGAGSPAELRRQLREQGLVLVKADPVSDVVNLARSAGSFRRRVGKGDILNLTSQLAIMAQAGVDIASSLKLVAMECPNPSLRETVQKVHERVAAGEAISEALRSQSQVFGEAYCASVAAGEASGKLAVVLARLAQLIRADIRLATTLRSVLAYPIVLLVVSMSVLIALVFFVLPTFSEVFERMGVPMPALTTFLLDASDLLTGNLFLLALAVGGGIGGMIFLIKHPEGRKIWDPLVLRMPLVGVVVRNLAVGRTFRLLGTMIESGVPVLESLGMCEKSVRNTVYRALYREMCQDVINGRGMSGALLKSPYIPRAAASMVSTGERTGNVGSILHLLGEHYESEAETKFRDTATIVEPALVIFVGAIVATVVLSLVLPMFDFTAAADAPKR